MPEKVNEGHRLTIGGICLESDTGKVAYIEPIAQYQGLTDEQVQDIWHYLQNPNRKGADKIQKAADELRDLILADMTEFGDERQNTRRDRE